VQSDLEPSSRRRPGSSTSTNNSRGSAPSMRSQPTSAPARLGPGLRRGDGGWLAAAICALTLAAPAQAAEPTPYQRALAAGYKAAFLCSGIFNAGRTQAQIEALELTGIYPEYQALVSSMPASVKRSGSAFEVTVKWTDSMPPRMAKWNEETGCSLLPIGWPLNVLTVHRGTPKQPILDKRPWPLGDSSRDKPSAALTPFVLSALNGTYGNGSRTVGVVVVQNGKLVAERYAEEFTAQTSNRTWSVAKSISGTLIGIAVQKRLLNTAQSANVPEWSVTDDPRENITLDNLLRMASGLHSDTAGNRTDALYMGATTVTQETVHWPLEVQPGTRFRYANNDTLLAIRSLRAALDDDERYLAFPRIELFEKIGMRHTVAETDWQGNFILSSQVWSTARDLARLGLLWLNDGVWQGERILPEGWMKYMTTPSGPQPAEGPGYGATLWLFGPKQGLPEGSYAAQGNRGQYIMVVPSHKLVIVRRGEDPHGSRFDIAKFTTDVIAALK
jgi:CubicO group peptidase (beta-lactamase class C family)